MLNGEREKCQELRAEVDRLSDILGRQCDWFDSLDGEEMMYCTNNADGNRVVWSVATDDVKAWWKENAAKCCERWDAQQEDKSENQSIKLS